MCLVFILCDTVFMRDSGLFIPSLYLQHKAKCQVHIKFMINVSCPAPRFYVPDSVLHLPKIIIVFIIYIPHSRY